MGEPFWEGGGEEMLTCRKSRQRKILNRRREFVTSDYGGGETRKEGKGRKKEKNKNKKERKKPG
jgi:hypothetical protein